MVDTEKIILYIKENLTVINAKDVAEKFYYSTDYLSRIFKSKFNISLREYIITERIKLSERFMDSGICVKRAGELSGFGNYSNFIRTYKKYRDITPGVYMRLKNCDMAKDDNKEKHCFQGFEDRSDSFVKDKVNR